MNPNGIQPLSVAVALQNANCGPDPNVTSWSDLAAVATFRIPGPLLKIWIEGTTGLTKTVKLIDSTEPSDPTNGVQRPNDYGPQNQRAWFAAG